MPDYGVLPEGWVGKTQEVLLADEQGDFKAQFGSEIDIAAQAAFGQFIGVLSNRFLEVWDLGQSLYGSQYRDSAVGAQLDQVCGLTGTIRRPASTSTVTATATGTATTLLPSGRVFQVVNGGAKFATTAAATITAVAARAGATPYVEGDRVKNGSAPARVYQALNDGTTGGGGGPTTTSEDITDGTVHWRYLGDGTGAVDVACAAQEYGPKAGNAFTLTVIITAVSGLSNVTNVLDAVVGTNLEADSTLRLRAETELRAQGRAAVEAIRAVLLELDDVQQAVVFQNPDDVTNGDGLPPHSIEAVVEGGLEADIVKTVYEAKAGGIQTYGTTSVSYTDTQGITSTVKYSRPSNINIYVAVTLKYEDGVYPTDGDDLVKAAIKTYGDTFKMGQNVVSSKLSAVVMNGLVDLVEAVPGVAEITSMFIGVAPAPGTSTTIANSIRQLAQFDTSRISVASSVFSP